jgi:Ca2+-binding RTX toxin-like protein
MRFRRALPHAWPRAALLGALLLFTTVSASVLTGSNTVPASKAGKSASSVGSNDVKPSDCSGITVSVTTTGSGVFSGTTADELILGGAAADTISGLTGNDCIVGGGGNDTIDGGLGTDVCIGGPGTDTFVSCETQVQ